MSPSYKSNISFGVLWREPGDAWKPPVETIITRGYGQPLSKEAAVDLISWYRRDQADGMLNPLAEFKLVEWKEVSS